MCIHPQSGLFPPSILDSMTDPTIIRQALTDYFGFGSFKGQQLEIIQSLLDGSDVFVLMPTGGGKSLCYQLPALIQEGTAIVISPLIALMKNQVDAIRGHAANESVAHFLNSTLTKAQIEKVKSDVMEGRTKLLYVAPESLTKDENVAFLRGVKISFFAIDEAHCISEWGHDFRPEYRKIRPIISRVGNCPVIALTATATPKVQHDIQKNLGMLDARVFKSSFNRENLYYEVRPKTKDIDASIIRFIKQNHAKSGIIYCLSRKKVEEMAELLKINGIRARAYHAGMEAQVRSANQDAFLNEEVDVIVATIAFGMGIDKPDVRYVIHYDIPKSLEGYYQETGRAGRDGGEGVCVAFYTRKDLQKLDKLMLSKTPAEQEIGRQLLAETAAYAESSLCRRKILLHYFGENYESDNCGNCDNCKHPKTLVEATEELCAVMETALALKEKYKAEYIANVMIGRATDEIRANGHDKIEMFGCMPDSDERMLAAVIRQADIAGYLIRDLENYGILKVTPKGKKYLKKPSPAFKVVEDSEYSDVEPEPVPTAGSGAADEVLYNVLVDLRKKIAKKNDVPPYVVFQESSLEAMATTYPVSMEELSFIPGVGSGKAKRFGEEFIEAIREYVEENDIVRPEDYKVRMMPNKSKLKVYLITGIDRKIALDELAEAKGLEFSELLDELEAIVEAGIKINIDYFLQDVLEEGVEEDILDYFSETEEDNLEEAIQDLGEEYTEEEIRLVRIKFLSDNGN